MLALFAVFSLSFCFIRPFAVCNSCSRKKSDDSPHTQHMYVSRTLESICATIKGNCICIGQSIHCTQWEWRHNTNGNVSPVDSRAQHNFIRGRGEKSVRTDVHIKRKQQQQQEHRMEIPCQCAYEIHSPALSQFRIFTRSRVAVVFFFSSACR